MDGQAMRQRHRPGGALTAVKPPSSLTHGKSSGSCHICEEWSGMWRLSTPPHHHILSPSLPQAPTLPSSRPQAPLFLFYSSLTRNTCDPARSSRSHHICSLLFQGSPPPAASSPSSPPSPASLAKDGQEPAKMAITLHSTGCFQQDTDNSII